MRKLKYLLKKVKKVKISKNKANETFWYLTIKPRLSSRFRCK